MIQETIEGRRVSSIQGFLLIIAIVAGMYLLSGLAGWLQAQLHALSGHGLPLHLL